MNCALCRKDVGKDLCVMVSEFQLGSENWYHKSCYDQSIENKLIFSMFKKCWSNAIPTNITVHNWLSANYLSRIKDFLLVDDGVNELEFVVVYNGEKIS